MIPSTRPLMYVRPISILKYSVLVRTTVLILEILTTQSDQLALKTRVLIDKSFGIRSGYTHYTLYVIVNLILQRMRLTIMPACHHP